MNIIDSIGVMLGGDSKPFDKMMDDVDKRLADFDRKMSSWAGKMTMYVSAPLLAMGTRNVFLFAEQEKAILGLQSQLGKVSAKPFVDFSNQLQDSLGKDNDAMVQLMSRFAAMGTAAKDLKKTTINALGVSAATGMGEFQAYRAMQMLKQGNTALFSRYIPGLSQMSQSQQEVKIIELINRGLSKTRAELLGVGGSFRSMKLAMDDAAKASGEMISKQLHLPELFRRMVGFYKNMETYLKAMPEETQKWVVWVGAGLAALGPVSFLLTKIGGVLASLVGATVMFAKTLITTVLPAVLLVAAAFLGWEIVKTVTDYQAGMFKIGQWTELVVAQMMKKWEQYFAFIKAGLTSASANDELAAAYGMAPNKAKQALAKLLPAGLIQTYADITETRGQKQERLNLLRQPLQLQYDMAKSAYDADPSNEERAAELDRANFQLQQGSPAIRELAAEIASMSSAGASDTVIAALERKFLDTRNAFTRFDENEGFQIEAGWDAIIEKMMEKFQKDNKENPGYTTFSGFIEALKKNATEDVAGVLTSVQGFFSKWFTEFMPPELKGSAPGKGDFQIGGKSDKAFASALEYGTREAFSAVFGNASAQDKLLSATERSADGIEALYDLIGGMGGDGGIPSAVVGS